MKEQALAALRRMYPNGVSSAQQHRDIVRVYVNGWLDALAHARDKLLDKADLQRRLKEQLAEVQVIADPNWWPGTDWTWWEGGSGEDGRAGLWLPPIASSNPFGV